MVRLSLILRRPVHEVLRWPLWVIRVYAEFLSREPAEGERIEWAVASLHQAYVGAHLKEGVNVPPLTDFLPFRHAWTDEGLDADLEREILNDLDGVVKR